MQDFTAGRQPAHSRVRLFAEACEEPPSPSPCEGDRGNPHRTVTTLGLSFHKEEG